MANTHSFLQPASFKDVNIFHHRLYNNSAWGSSFLPPNAHMATCFPDHTPEAKAERCCRASSSDASLGPSPRLPETAGGARPGGAAGTGANRRPAVKSDTPDQPIRRGSYRPALRRNSPKFSEEADAGGRWQHQEWGLEAGALPV